MEYNETTKQLSVSFRNMQLKKIKRAEKKGTESVMDEKFALLFQSGFTIGNGELKFSVWALSLPVVVIVHGNQEPQSWATITWDNAFAEINRTPFVVPDKVPWPRLGDALNMKFRASTGRQLTPDNLHFLGEKVFKASIMQTITDDYQVSWSSFCKEPLPDRTFTFWEWYYAAMKLTREHLRGPWGEGSIVGFIQKKTAEDVLIKCQRGTFLLRFSDSELGKSRLLLHLLGRVANILGKFLQVESRLHGVAKAPMAIPACFTSSRSQRKTFRHAHCRIVYVISTT